MFRHIKQHQYILFLCIVLITISFLYLYQLVNSYNYDYDFGRDLVEILQITQGNITLLGPKLSFGGLHAGPYYYYLFAPILKIFSLLPESILYFNAFVFISVLVVSLIVTYKSSPTLAIGIIWIFLTPFMILSGRNPSNALSYMPILFGVLITFPHIFNKKSILLSTIYGFIIGVVINFHFINLLIFAPLLFITFIYIVLKRDYRRLLLIATIIIGIIVSFAPLILFEFRHDFVQIKNTFINQSYLSFSDNKNINTGIATSQNPVINFWLLQKHFTTWSNFPFLVLFSTNIILLITRFKQIKPTSIIIGISSITSTLLLTTLANSQVAFHYLFPFILFTQISLLYLLSDKALYLGLVFILFNIIFLPTSFYTPSNRSIDNYRNFINQLINTNIIDNSSQYNLINLRETPTTILGWEYRYFINLKNIHLLSPTEFNTAPKLIIIQENNNNQDISTLKLWETDQFGPKELNQKIQIGDHNIFLFDRI